MMPRRQIMHGEWNWTMYTGDTTLMFSHNTDFTDIMWKNKLTVHFMNMTPHVGQDFYLAVVDTATGIVLSTVDTVASEDFMLNVYGLEPGTAYNVDFWADFNENGMYDAPPADHAWRIQLDSIVGDSTLMFTHNTDFTDIMWQKMMQNTLTVHFTGMTPHVGQDFHLAVIDTSNWMEVARVDTVASEDFMIMYPDLKPACPIMLISGPISTETECMMPRQLIMHGEWNWTILQATPR